MNARLLILINTVHVSFYKEDFDEFANFPPSETYAVWYGMFV